MVVSFNPEPEKESFQFLLSNTIAELESEAKKNQDKFLSLLGIKFEDVVLDVMNNNAKGTPFENSIELISGQRFPDIIAAKYYGVEVKTTKQNHWTTTGNSVLEGTRVDGIERIFMLFGKMNSPVEFKCKPYEECLSEVVVTHSPRYQINMNLGHGETIFDKLQIKYDALRNLNNPVQPIIDYYRKFLKPGEEVWWIDQESDNANGLIIKLWNNLSVSEHKEYMRLAMVLFPEIFSNRSDKFNRIAIWLVNMKGVVCPNIRDAFTAGGKGQIIFNGITYSEIPQIIIRMVKSFDEIKNLLGSIEGDTLLQYWGQLPENRLHFWLNLVAKNAKTMHLDINLVEYFSSL